MLKQQRILVTRPAHQADSLCALIEVAGGQAIQFPTIDITPITHNAQSASLAEIIQRSQWLIFISANAVEWGLKILENTGFSQKNIKIAAVGRKTAHCLAEAGLIVDLVPMVFNSESLLAEPSLQTQQITGQHITIIQGEGGRDKLANTLRQRGARVLAYPVYRRQLPQINLAAHTWLKQGEIDCILCTSVEGLQNLVHLLQAPAWLWQKRLVLMGSRLVEKARTLGFTGTIIVAKEASDAGLMHSLINMEKAQSS